MKRWVPGRDPRSVFHPAVAPSGALGRTGRVIVVGGGIAGLAAATGLAERGIAVTVVEEKASLGGRVRAWPIDLPDGSRGSMSRGFHAFFRQYYNLRSLLSRADPTLERLRPLADYPLRAANGTSESFTGIPRTPPLNLVGFVARSPSFTLADLTRVDIKAALGLLQVSFPASLSAWDGVSAAELLDRLRFPQRARHLALEVFARSFFAAAEDFSAAELLAMFHAYFVGSAEGLLFDVPDDDYDTCLWAPLANYLTRRGVDFVTRTRVEAVTLAAGEVVVHTDARELAATQVVLALPTQPLRELVGASPTLAEASWRERIAELRSAPPFGVLRRWLDAEVDAPPFEATTGYAACDNVSLVDRFEATARRWRATHGGSVVELHGYALTKVEGSQERLWDDFLRIHPDAAAAGVRHSEWLIAEDCPLWDPSPWDRRPTVQTPWERVVLAGDLVRCDLPVALMERAATTGFMAANELLARRGLSGQGLWSVPMAGLLGSARRFGGVRRRRTSTS